jgi:Ala-tRNA(Pro) deacylase
MKIPERLVNFLDDHHAPYERIQHPARFTAQELAEVEHIDGRHHAKVVMLKDGIDPLMMVLPADRMIDFDKLPSRPGRSVTLAKEDEFKSLFPDCEPGAMPPFGDLYGVPTYVDRTLTDDDYIVFEAGTHTDAMKMNYREWERLAHPVIADFSIGNGQSSPA